jgi:hypothetical protein
MATDSKEQFCNQIPELDIKKNDIMPITKALTERRNADMDRGIQGNFHKKKSMDRSSGEISRKFYDGRCI